MPFVSRGPPQSSQFQAMPLCSVAADGGSIDTVAAEVFAQLLSEIRSCRLCATELPFAPRPLVRGLPSARLLIISQAPGIRAHQTGLSFDDRSGDRLRDWLGIDRE